MWIDGIGRLQRLASGLTEAVLSVLLEDRTELTWTKEPGKSELLLTEGTVRWCTFSQWEKVFNQALLVQGGLVRLWSTQRLPIVRTMWLGPNESDLHRNTSLHCHCICLSVTEGNLHLKESLSVCVFVYVP